MSGDRLRERWKLTFTYVGFVAAIVLAQIVTGWLL